MSFRTAQGRRIFGTFEDSFHGFKDKFFKVRPAEGVHLFWLTLEGERQIPTYWSFGAGSNAFTKITYKGLTWRDKNIADVLLTIFNKNNINPHLLMGDWEMGRGYIVDMAAGHTGLEDLMSQFLPSHSEDSSATPSAEQPSSPTAEAESASPPPKSAGAIVTTSQSSSAVVPPEVEPANEGPNVVVVDNPRKRKPSPVLRDPLLLWRRTLTLGVSLIRSSCPALRSFSMTGTWALRPGGSTDAC
ncbi:uncharacterized protein [Arachis hypogaea]|uniref:uncharacterized protein isoform X1 n=1 Tax=Arachis hypogaea TaxID=3818 RepID=UPI003B217C5A